MKTPIGLWWDINHLRVMKNTFNDDNARKYIIEEAKRDVNNDVDIVVIDETANKSSVFELNESYNDFIQIQNKRLSRKMDTVWKKYLTSKVKVQHSELSVKDKSKFVDLAKTKYLDQIKLSDKNNSELENKLKKL